MYHLLGATETFVDGDAGIARSLARRTRRRKLSAPIALFRHGLDVLLDLAGKRDYATSFVLEFDAS